MYSTSKSLVVLCGRNTRYSKHPHHSNCCCRCLLNMSSIDEGSQNSNNRKRKMSNVEGTGDPLIGWLTNVFQSENPENKVKELKSALGGKSVHEMLVSIVEHVISLIGEDVIKSVAPFKLLLSECLVCCNDNKESLEQFGNKCNELIGWFDTNGLQLECSFALSSCSGKAKERAENAKSSDDTARLPTRIVDIDYQISDSKLIRYSDFIKFADRVKDLFDWFGNDFTKDHRKFIAPYFPLIQSSGTGKTLLLKKFRDFVMGKMSVDEVVKLKAEKGLSDDCESILTESICILILVNGKQREIYDKLIDPISFSNMTKNEEIREKINSNLDEFINAALEGENKAKKKIILLFDEAQGLLKDDAFLFRCIRWWLRKERDLKIVAVFTGTTSRLSNYFPEKLVYDTSRDAPTTYYNGNLRNLAFYSPFYELTTIGIMANVSLETGGDYEIAAMYGRPLFATMCKNGKLVDATRSNILRRMVFGEEGNYFQHLGAVANVIGTRIQMGHISKLLSSKFVADGYAHLVGFTSRSNNGSGNHENERIVEEDAAHVCFLPDPVCAHQAMCLMDCNYQSHDKSIVGHEKKEWTKAATELFSSGICHPHKGDVGEAAAALFLLFCGDVIRERMSKRNGITFAVDLREYVTSICKYKETAVVPAAKISITSANNNSGNSNAENDNANTEENVDTKYKISFISVHRQYTHTSLKKLIVPEVLERLFKSGNALYLPACFPVFDILASIRCTTNGKVSYVPFAVSVKSRQAFGAAAIQIELEWMSAAMKRNKIDGALCLLLLLDLPENKIPALDKLLDNSLNDVNLVSEVVCKATAVGPDDLFGIDDLVRNTRVFKNDKCEKFASHWMNQSY